MTKIKIIKVALIFLFCLSQLFAQTSDNSILLSIGSHEVNSQEFERIYKKNRYMGNTSLDISIDEYLDLFVKFKLKVVQAEELGYDTLVSFISELNGYRDQLAKPYLTDQATISELVQEAYERSKTDVHASHILIKTGIDLSTEEQQEFYKKAYKIRERIVAGESFSTVARGTSDDPSAKFNGGDLGYFTVFQMIYPFETVAYNTPAGEISMPVFTRFGYHIIQVHNQRESRGNIKVAHIMVAVPRGSSKATEDQAKAKIKMIQEKNLNGEDFHKLAKEFSDDYNSAKNGGELPWFGTGKMIPEFDQAAFALKSNGAISEPVRTPYGWHLIKRIDQKELGSFEASKDELERKIFAGNRTKIAKQKFIEILTEEYSFEVDSNLLIPFYLSINDSSLTDGSWIENGHFKDSGILIKFIGNTLTTDDFKSYIKAQKSLKLRGSSKDIVDKLLSDYSAQILIAFEKSKLEDKYPEFKYLIKEYHDGMLLFEISDKKVWSKAVEDTIGLKEYYRKNKKDYMAEEKIRFLEFTIQSPEQEKFVSKAIKKGKRKNHKLAYYQNYFPTDTTGNSVNVESKEFYKTDFKQFNFSVLQKNLSKKHTGQESTTIILITKLLEAQPKQLNEIRGLVTSDYQNFLEAEWEKALKDDYEVILNQDVLDGIRSKNQ